MVCRTGSSDVMIMYHCQARREKERSCGRMIRANASLLILCAPSAPNQHAKMVWEGRFLLGLVDPAGLTAGTERARCRSRRWAEWGTVQREGNRSSRNTRYRTQPVPEKI